jgi:hypothetical protein
LRPARATPRSHSHLLSLESARLLPWAVHSAVYPSSCDRRVPVRHTPGAGARRPGRRPRKPALGNWLPRQLMHDGSSPHPGSEVWQRLQADQQLARSYPCPAIPQGMGYGKSVGFALLGRRQLGRPSRRLGPLDPGSAAAAARVPTGINPRAIPFAIILPKPPSVPKKALTL